MCKQDIYLDLERKDSTDIGLYLEELIPYAGLAKTQRVVLMSDL